MNLYLKMKWVFFLVCAEVCVISTALAGWGDSPPGGPDSGRSSDAGSTRSGYSSSPDSFHSRSNSPPNSPPNSPTSPAPKNLQGNHR